MRQLNFTWFTPTLGLRPPKIVQTKPSKFYIFIKKSNKVTICNVNVAINFLSFS